MLIPGVQEEMEKYMNGRLVLQVGDITKVEVDAVVNAANSSLLGGGGVDGAIHKAGGPEILEECKEIRQNDYPNGLPTGKAVITTAGEMPASRVIHTVGPVWDGGTKNEDDLLEAAYRNCLDLAAAHAMGSIAFPAISTGVYGFPQDRAARIAVQAIRSFLQRNTVPRTVHLIFFSEADHEAFVTAAGDLLA
jgi:O-acetyl-ADP-ribose deacetylase (regulator of RNase III)